MATQPRPIKKKLPGNRVKKWTPKSGDSDANEVSKEMNRVQRLILKLRDAKSRCAHYDEIARDHQNDLLDEFVTLDLKKASAMDGDVEISATIVEPTTLKIDEEKLRVALGDRYQQYTKVVFDPKLLEDAVARGEVDAKVVAKCSEVVAKSPYIRITEKTVK
jgi:hypothetical protein